MGTLDDKVIALYHKNKSVQPSSEIDKQIIAAAKTRLNKPAKSNKRVIWALSSVAVIVLSVNVALKLVIEPLQTTSIPESPIILQEHQSPQFDAFEDKESDQSFAIDSEEVAQPMMAPAPTKKQIAEPSKKVIKRQHKSPTSLKAKQRSSMPKANLQPKEFLVHTPSFPFNTAKLKQQYSTLNIQQVSDNEIKILNKNQMILKLEKQVNSLVKVTAYPHNNELNLKLNWSIKPTQLKGCKTIQTVSQCPLEEGKTAHFINNKVRKITWMNK